MCRLSTDTLHTSNRGGVDHSSLYSFGIINHFSTACVIFLPMVSQESGAIWNTGALGFLSVIPFPWLRWLCTWERNLWPGAEMWNEVFFNWNVALVWRLQECSCHCQGCCLGCPSTENRRTESRGSALVYFQVFKLGRVSIHIWETDEEKATRWFLSLGGGVMDLQLFWVLILRLTSVLTSITISFDIL